MFQLRLLLRNAFRQRIRAGLTLIGLVVAVSAFGLLRTIVDAWYAGVDATSSTRLVTRNAISLTFPLPPHYAERIRAVEGVGRVTWSNWFGGVYITERNFFAQFAVDAASFFPLYPEYKLDAADYQAFLRDKQGCIVGRKLAAQFGWKVGDTIPLRGTTYPGNWSFVVRGIYQGADRRTDEQQMFIHWQRLVDTLKVRWPKGSRFEHVGVFIVGIEHPDEAPVVAQRIDALFHNSLAETLTETEKAFQLGFVSMSEAILLAVQAVSLIILVIILAVMANTMTMTARERLGEYATLKALGFRPGFVVRLLLGESMVICALGGAIGVALTWPMADAFRAHTGTLFPVFQVSGTTVALQALACVVVGVVAAAWPAWKMSRIDIVQGLRHVA